MQNSAIVRFARISIGAPILRFCMHRYLCAVARMMGIIISFPLSGIRERRSDPRYLRSVRRALVLGGEAFDDFQKQLEIGRFVEEEIRPQFHG